MIHGVLQSVTTTDVQIMDFSLIGLFSARSETQNSDPKKKCSDMITTILLRNLWTLDTTKLVLNGIQSELEPEWWKVEANIENVTTEYRTRPPFDGVVVQAYHPLVPLLIKIVHGGFSRIRVINVQKPLHVKGAATRRVLTNRYLWSQGLSFKCELRILFAPFHSNIVVANCLRDNV